MLEEWIVVDRFGTQRLGPKGKKYAEDYDENLYEEYRVELKN